MQIAGQADIMSLWNTEEVEQAKKIKLLREKYDTEDLFLTSSGDTVTISQEARDLAAAFQSGDTTEGEKEQSGEESTGQAGPQGSGGAGGAGGSEDSASQVEKLKKQIEQLQAKLVQVAGSGMPEQAKESAIQGYQAQIAELEAQINELSQDSAKG